MPVWEPVPQTEEVVSAGACLGSVGGDALTLWSARGLNYC
jgi:hypothetical protein